MEKELMIIRDNSERLKRKYELDIYQMNTELEQGRRKQKQQEERIKTLLLGSEEVSQLELKVAKLETALSKAKG